MVKEQEIVPYYPDTGRANMGSRFWHKIALTLLWIGPSFLLPAVIANVWFPKHWIVVSAQIFGFLVLNAVTPICWRRDSLQRKEEEYDSEHNLTFKITFGEPKITLDGQPRP